LGNFEWNWSESFNSAWSNESSIIGRQKATKISKPTASFHRQISHSKFHFK
jgi:hypothetical protein